MSGEDLLSRRARLGESSPAPVASEADRRGARAGTGALTSQVPPPANVDVTAVWESRLINMRDFYRTVSAEMALPGNTVVGFNVPAGRAGFLKLFRFDIDPLPAVGGASNYLLTLLHNGVPVPDYQDLPLGQMLVAPLPCFLVADEGDSIGLRMRQTGGTTPAGPLTFTAHFWGHFALRGRKPVNLEVGTERRAAP